MYHIINEPRFGWVLLAMAGAAAPIGARADLVFYSDFAVFPSTPGADPATYSWGISVDDGAITSFNPTLVVKTGSTYHFYVNTSIDHPFWIDQSPGLGGGDPYMTGLSDNGVSSSATITMNLPADAPGTLYYACENHSSMTGSILVVHDLVYRSGFD
jgi:plastocyanin